MRRPLASNRALPAVALAITFGTLCAAGCRPIHTAHGFDYAYPRKRSDFTVRFLGTASGHAAIWISTANDGEANGRYEGRDVVVDPGTPAEVEATVIPYLESHGLPKGAPLAYILSTGAEPPMLAGVARLAREFNVGRVVSPPPPGPRGPKAPDLGGAMPGYLDLGPEITARALVPEGTAGLGAQSYGIRFIDTQLVLLPSVPAASAADYGRAIEGVLRKEGLHATIVAAEDAALAPAVRALAPELVVGAAKGEDATLAIAAPAAGATVDVTTNGTEIHAPGPRTRTGTGWWIDCSSDAACAASLSATPSGALMVELPIGGDDAWFLVDTRAPVSFLVRPRYEKLPGWRTANTTPEEHGSEPVGAEVPRFRAGATGLTVSRWHVLPCPPFTVGGHDAAGVLGLDFLKAFRMTVSRRAGQGREVRLEPNFDEERETLEPARTLDGGARYDLPMDNSPAGPLILSNLDGEPRSLVVDLAAAESTVFVRPEEIAMKAPGAAARRWGSFEAPGDYSGAKWSESEVIAGPLKVTDLNLFGAHFPNRTLLAVDRPLAADVLGMDFLDDFAKVELDFRRRSLRLERESAGE